MLANILHIIQILFLPTVQKLRIVKKRYKSLKMVENPQNGRNHHQWVKNRKRYKIYVFSKEVYMAV